MTTTVYPVALIVGVSFYFAVFTVKPVDEYQALAAVIAGSICLAFSLRLKWRKP